MRCLVGKSDQMMWSVNANLASFESIDEIQRWILEAVLTEGEESRPRHMRTLELPPTGFKLLNPRSRCVMNRRRRWSLPLALGEFCWHISGSKELQFIEYYAPQWRRFAENEEIIGSCYGHRIFKQEFNRPDQWHSLIDLLKTDPYSRRAILFFSEPTASLSAYAKDVACASSIQFLVRGDRLHAVVYMRSNDVIWGLPYDVFLFTMIQELLACELGVGLGTYSHFAASFHLYERHFELARAIVNSEKTSGFEMPPMTGHHQLSDFLKLEIKQRKCLTVTVNESSSLNGYWRSLLSVLEWYTLTKKLSRTGEAVYLIENSLYAPVLNL